MHFDYLQNLTDAIRGVSIYLLHYTCINDMYFCLEYCDTLPRAETSSYVFNISILVKYN
jgi:hypothetical protein